LYHFSDDSRGSSKQLQQLRMLVLEVLAMQLLLHFVQISAITNQTQFENHYDTFLLSTLQWHCCSMFEVVK